MAGSEEAKGKGEELADSIGNLSIGAGRTNFKKKPVIILVIGMAGASIPFVNTQFTCLALCIPPLNPVIG
jgi:hypothetical protein